MDLKWNKSKEELFEIGLSNVKNKYEKDIFKIEMNDVELTAILDEEGYATTLFLDKDEFNKYVGDCGVFIGMPNQVANFIYTVETTEIFVAVHSMAMIIKEEFKKANSLSDNLFWYNGVDLIHIPVEFVDDKIQVHPPKEFVEMLEKLSKK